MNHRNEEEIYIHEDSELKVKNRMKYLQEEGYKPKYYINQTYYSSSGETIYTQLMVKEFKNEEIEDKLADLLMKYSEIESVIAYLEAQLTYQKIYRNRTEKDILELDKKLKEIRIRIFKRDDYTCFYCNVRGGQLECDHYVPVSREGSNEDSNLVTACKPCNRSKSNKIPEDFLN